MSNLIIRQYINRQQLHVAMQTAVDNVKISENSPRRVAELKLQLQASIASMHNGFFVWRIPDILRRRREAIENRITSIFCLPFYSNGYKMCIRAYLNGDGMGYKMHLSLFFVVMKGEFDALLKWPFDYKRCLSFLWIKTIENTLCKHSSRLQKLTVSSGQY